MLPIRTVSEANDPSHWRLKRARKLKQQQEVRVELSNALGGNRVKLPCRVTLVRLGAKKLDPDNLANSFKGIQDEIARVLRVDDGDDSRVKWTYDQEPQRVRKYAVRITIKADPTSLPI